MPASLYFNPTIVLLQPIYAISEVELAFLFQSYNSLITTLDYGLIEGRIKLYFNPTIVLLQQEIRKLCFCNKQYFNPTIVLLQLYIPISTALSGLYFNPTIVLLQLSMQT